MVLARRVRSRKPLQRLRVAPTDGVNLPGRCRRRRYEKCVTRCRHPQARLDDVSLLARYLSVEITRWRRSRAPPSPDLVTHSHQLHCVVPSNGHTSSGRSCLVTSPVDSNNCSQPPNSRAAFLKLPLLSREPSSVSPSVHSSDNCCCCDCRYYHGANTLANCCYTSIDFRRRRRLPSSTHTSTAGWNIARVDL